MASTLHLSEPAGSTRSTLLHRGDTARGLAVLDLVIWLMVSTYLFVDTASGVLRQFGAGEAALSQAWKGGIFILILLVSLRRSATTILIIGFSALLLLLAPFLRLFLTGTADDLGWEASMALKPLLPLTVLLWCADQQKADYDMLQRWPRRALWLSVAAVVLNIAAGRAGFGFSSYATYSEGSDGIGTIGFFYAANELGGTFAVLCGFVLMELWNRRRGWYLVGAVVAILMAFAIATKSAIVSALLLVPLIPLAYQRGNWLRMPATLVAALAIGATLLVVAAVRVWSVLEAAGLADKLQYVYGKQGWAGIILSGRDNFVSAVFRLVRDSHSFLDVFLGPGIRGLNLFGVKESVEMDPLDLYLWFGVPGLLFLLLFVVSFLYVPMSARRDDPTNQAAPAVQVTTLVLLAIAVIAGHIILGGMAGIAWAVMTALVFARPAGWQRAVGSARAGASIDD